jgi:HK97 family phage major capsid protein/HK97 family phage prohead protease
MMATDFPGKGDDQKITLRNSEYPQFDREFAENIAEFNSEVWELGGNIRGNEAFDLWGRARDGSDDPEVLDWIKEREAWAARHFNDGSQFADGDLEPNRSNVSGIVAQMKWGVIGNLGEQTMKDTILELVKKLEGKKEERQLSEAVETGLANKRDEHNEEVGDDPLRRATISMLREVFRRGVGAYETNPGSVRPGVSGPDQWAYSRVNSFLFALKNDRFQGGKHDTDLFPDGHPLASEERMEHEDERPYPNEHAARINDPEKYDEFRRQANVGGEGIDFIFGMYSVDDERVSEIQSVRFDADRYTMQQALEWLDENDMEPMKFEEAVGERNEVRHIIEITEDDDAILIKFGKGMEFEGINVMPEEVQDDEEMEMEVEVERYLKTETLHRAEAMEADKVDDRRVRMSISSEMAVERGYGKEVLDHSRESVDLDFLNSGRAPLLLDHDPERQIGVVESVDLDGDARRLRAVVRFSRNALASEVYDDVVDGIRGNVSIGYRVTKMDRDEGDTSVFRATSWQPLEVSVVSIPADQSVGVGRAHETSPETENPVPVIEEIKMEQSNETVRQEALAAFQKEVGEIIDLAVRHNQRALADEAIRKGLNLAQFRGLLLEKIADKPLDAAEIDMTPKEQRQYSLMNAIRSASLGKLDGFEAEVSQELARHYGKDARGFYVPTSIFKRDIQTTSPANGSNLVPEDHLGGEFIDALRANLVISGLGARMMQGLKGDVAIPALNAKTTVGFVGENAAPSEGAPTFRQVTMSPKELRQYVDISRKLMMQSDPSVEQIIRDDLTRQFAAKIDEVAIEGAGANEPTGILQTNGIGSVALGTNGGAITYASLVDLEKEVAIDNALNGSLAFLTNPKVVGEMRQTPRQTSGVEGNFILNDTNSVLGYNVASTTLVPSDLTKGTTSNSCSAVIFGDFSQLMIGMFNGLDVLVDPYSGSDKGATRIAMYQDVDVAVRHAESFAAIQDVTTV